MTKNRRINLSRLLYVSILLVLVLIAVFIYVQTNKPYTEIINLNWSIKLPQSYEEIYSADSGASFHGDGERYHIFEYTNKEDINLSLKWEDNKNEAVESAIMKVLNDLNTSKDNMPDFNSKYKYYTKSKDDSSTIYLIWFTDTKRLYVVEDIY